MTSWLGSGRPSASRTSRMGRPGGRAKRTTSCRGTPVGLKSVTAVVQSTRPAAAQAARREVAGGVDQGRRPSAGAGRRSRARFASSVPFQAWSPSIAQLHSARSRASRVAAARASPPASGGERLGGQVVALRLSRGRRRGRRGSPARPPTSGRSRRAPSAGRASAPRPRRSRGRRPARSR